MYTHLALIKSFKRKLAKLELLYKSFHARNLFYINNSRKHHNLNRFSINNGEIHIIPMWAVDLKYIIKWPIIPNSL